MKVEESVAAKNLYSGVNSLLLVDDDAIIALNTSEILQEMGYNVIIASSGEKAFALSKENADISLVLMDIDLGHGIDGTKTAELILANRNLPIVFLTSHTERAMVERVRHITRYGYVVKNSGTFVLQSSIEMAYELFESRQRASENDAKKWLMQAELARKQAFLSDLAETSPVALVATDQDGRISWANARAERLLGLTARSITAFHYDSPELSITDFDGQAIDSEALPFALVKKYGKTLIDFQHAIRWPNGHKIFISINASPLLDGAGRFMGMVASIDDITKRRELELTLQKTRRLLLASGSLARVGGWELEIKTGQITWTEEVHRIHDVDPEFVPTLESAINFYTPESRTAISEAVNMASTQGMPFDLKLEIISAKGVKKWVRALGNIKVHGDGANVLSGAFQDISQDVQAQMELSQLLAEKTTLLREVNHRVKNNLGAIEGLLLMQARKSQVPVVASALQDSMHRVQCMRVLYTKLYTSPGFRQVSAKDYLEALVDEIIEVFPSSARVHCTREIVDVLIDEKRILPIGIITNELISNALKYAYLGRDAGNLSVHCVQADGKLLLTIEDDGVGMPDKKDESKHNGFGLDLVRLLSSQLGATMSSEQKAGTKVSLLIPL